MLWIADPKVGNFINTTNTRPQNGNRYRELTLEDEDSWQNIQSSVGPTSPSLAAATSLGRAPTTPLMSRAKLGAGSVPVIESSLCSRSVRFSDDDFDRIVQKKWRDHLLEKKRNDGRLGIGILEMLVLIH